VPSGLAPQHRSVARVQAGPPPQVQVCSVQVLPTPVQSALAQQSPGTHWPSQQTPAMTVSVLHGVRLGLVT
jgi:hypothetical protein